MLVSRMSQNASLVVENGEARAIRILHSNAFTNSANFRIRLRIVAMGPTTGYKKSDKGTRPHPVWLGIR